MIARRTWLAAALLACAALTGACSLVVAPETQVVRCSVDPAFPDPCPPNFECLAEVCVERLTPPPPPDGCVATQETCNALDDNCNGVIDDGVDADGDGYTFCGTPRDGDGNFVAGALSPQYADCADDDPNTYPGAPERCDGVDNDCSAATPADVDAEVCPMGFVCGGRMNTCVDPLDCLAFPCSGTEVCDLNSRRCAVGGCPTCSGTERCDVGTGTCVPRRSDGGDCNVDEECLSGTCFDLAQLGATSSHATRGVCSRACCNATDCPGAADLCFAAQSGARACLPPSTPAALALALRINASCDSLASMCTFSYQPTGWCEFADATICYFAGALNCLFPLDGTTCGSPCERGDDCGTDSMVRCGLVLAGTTVTGVCYGSTTRTYLNTGDTCTSSAECRDGECIAGVCAKPCCTDSDCDVGKCLPSPGTFALMRCQGTGAALP